MIEYITAINRRFLTSVIENTRERVQIVTDMLNCIEKLKKIQFAD